MFGLGLGELAIVGGILFIVFGAKRLPDLGHSLGKGITNFKKGLKDEDQKELPPQTQASNSDENPEKTSKDA